MAATQHRPTPDAPVDRPALLPDEVGNALLGMADAAVPIRVVSQLARDLSAALQGRVLGDADVVVLAWMLTRASGPWLPSPHRFRQLKRQVDALLTSAGCARAAIVAVVDDLEQAFVSRTRRALA
jgi:hypothetical protein